MPSKKPKRAASSVARGPLDDPPNTRFIADAMLGSLARKLRAFGFDTRYYRSGDDPSLLELARSEDRVLLTSDRSLASLAGGRGVTSFAVSGASDGRRLASIRSAAGALGVSLKAGQPRCSLCNGELASLGRQDVVGRLPRGVQERHRVFFRCRSCGRYYWKGSHWKKLRWLGTRLAQESDADDPRRRQESRRVSKANLGRARGRPS